MEILKNNVAAPNGFTAIGKCAGIKNSNKLDLGVIFSEAPAACAAVYTKNSVKGAPLHVTKSHLKDDTAQAIVINSGISNVFTGEKGIKDAEKMTELVGKELSIKKEDVLVASTGLIGAFLPMSLITEGIKGIKNNLSKESKIAQAILTTDSEEKELAIKVDNFTIGAIAKGSGMVHPNMATMLCFITTDASIQASKLNSYLKSSVEKSFNMTSVDMDTSTSDMAVVMANGLAGKVDQKKFQDTLDYICIELAKLIAKDGEGSSTYIEVEIKNASSEEDAKNLAKSVISSNLVKCAVYGKDPNWGRVICALGNSKSKLKEELIDIYFGNELIVKQGAATAFDTNKVKASMNEELKITINMNLGKHNATSYGCDLTENYVKFNSKYTT